VGSWGELDWESERVRASWLPDQAATVLLEGVGAAAGCYARAVHAAGPAAWVGGGSMAAGVV
jgi:hypothetical protein